MPLGTLNNSFGKSSRDFIWDSSEMLSKISSVILRGIPPGIDVGDLRDLLNFCLGGAVYFVIILH